MEQNKGKPVTTSVPSIAIRFHANAEQLEELYGSDEEHPPTNDSSSSSGGAAPSTAGASEPESSPLKYLPRLVKRSTSIDITPATNIDASPPSDPWRFFSDIKGKITKSVEEKLTDFKARNQEEGSPLKTKTVKDSKDNSSLSDSESESSISKTCGIMSTTEGAEMSSDDEETPSMEKDKKIEPIGHSKATSGLRQRFRLLRSKASAREGTVPKNHLTKLYNINTEKIEQALPEDSEVESAVDALEEQQQHDDKVEVLLGCIENEIDNIEVDKEKVVNVKEVAGSDVRHIQWVTNGKSKTVFAPVGFVDMRVKAEAESFSFLPVIALGAFLVFFILMHQVSSYCAGFTLGIFVTYLIYYLISLLHTPASHPITIKASKQILEVPAVKEHQPLSKYEGWVNELPEVYNPHTYHISQTQSVFLRLQGNLLRVSHSRAKIPKRALWNEPQLKPAFTNHRIYNLMRAKITLLPEGLAKKRHWSKKYPICITLHKDQLNFEPTASLKIDDEDEDKSVAAKHETKGKKPFGFKRKKYHELSQRFSKLTEEEETEDIESDTSRASSPSPPSPDFSDETGLEDSTQKMVAQQLKDNLEINEDQEEPFHDYELESLPDDWSSFSPDDSPIETKLYIFGRTDREKEDWFRRFAAATHYGANVPLNDALNRNVAISDTLIQSAMDETEYIKYMLIFNKQTPKKSKDKNEKGEKCENAENESKSCSDETPSVELLWINAFIGRVLFDCLHDDNFTQRVKDRIQRKLATIKLPYFIEELLVTELSLGQTPPLVHRASKPFMDERGLWIDLDITYEGLIVLILQTKLNLMKLKQPHSNEKNVTEERSAMFHSDVDDSAESTSDEEAAQLLQNAPPLDASGLPVAGLGGTSNTSKKFMKMVDRIAESKFFQAATEYRYIKKAMEGVSNTDLRLRVEVKELVGTLVLNIPPPPSDRVWIGFRPTPELALAAQPIVGERNITFLRITSWIEKKLLQEFQKLLVIPNMEDFTIPVMCQKLPE